MQPENAGEMIYQAALALHQQKQFDAALEKYQEYLLVKNDSAEAWLNLGILYYQTEAYSNAVSAIFKCLELDAFNAIAYYVLGACLENLDNETEAIVAYYEAIALDPNLMDAYSNLGVILVKSGEITQAEAVYRQAISVNPSHWGSYVNLGNLLLEQKQIDLAIEVYQTALKTNQKNQDLLNNLEIARNLILESANQFYQQGRYEDAIAPYQKVLQTGTIDAEIYFYLSDCFRYLNREDEAILTLSEGIRLDPSAAKLHFALITILQTSGRIEEAIESAETASQLLPNNYTFKIFKNLMLPLVYETEEQIKFYRQRFERGLQNLIQQTSLNPESKSNALKIVCVTTFYLGHQGVNVLKLQRQWGNLIHQIMAANYPQWVEPLSPPPLPNNKIRIGYISSYFYAYSGTLWLGGWLRHCNKEKFEIYCYYTGEYTDTFTQECRNYSDVFHQIYGNLEAVCQQIIADELHILVYPEIGMDAQTVKMAGLRLAPVQCTAWGHPVTSGLPTIDYFLSSELMEPKDAQEHYSEKLIRLPNIGVAYPKTEDITSVKKSRADFGLADDAVIYLCCQAPFKYLPQHDYIFAEIARRLPQSRFVFLRGKLLTKRLARAFAGVGLKSEDYCLFLNIPSRSDYLTINLLSDVFLDTLSWSGGNTSLEAIACNLPIVTCPGEFMRGRHAYAFLKMLDVTDTIAQNEAEYIDIAVKLGLNPTWRRDISERIKTRHDYLYDDKVCVQGLEAFYQQVVQKYV